MNVTLILPVLITLTGIILLFRLRFFFVIHPIRTAKKFLSAANDREARRALYLALAGTLGVGNIFGVAAGIMIGGPGIVLWLVVSSFFSMIIKYAETFVVCENVTDKGGMAGALPKILKRNGKKLSILYAMMTVVLALTMGSAIQSAALIDVAEKTIEMNKLVGGLILATMFVPCLVGGTRKIENITEMLIPLTTILYIFACFAVIFAKMSNFIPTVNLIIKSAFSPQAFTTGAFLIAIKEGFARGMLSNEAGIGTSALAHSKIRHKSSSAAGVLGMSEVFFDTTLLCTLTAMVILLSVKDIGAFSTPMSLVYTAFTSTLGRPFGYILLGMVFAFAYSTIICWYYYGYECVNHYFALIKPTYIMAFVSVMILSPYVKTEKLLFITDLTMLAMAFITLFCIMKLIDKIKSP